MVKTVADDDIVRKLPNGMAELDRDAFLALVSQWPE
jgi:hypothetical protein